MCVGLADSHIHTLLLQLILSRVVHWLRVANQTFCSFTLEHVHLVWQYGGCGR